MIGWSSLTPPILGTERFVALTMGGKAMDKAGFQLAG
jgi:hypothetical protein